MKETDKAWLAGIVDGEGCIAFLRRNDYGKHKLEVRCDLKIAMADKETILHIGDLIEEVVGDDSVRVFEEKRNIRRRRPLWRVEVNSKRAVKQILTFILPFLITKKLEARLSLDYLSRSTLALRYRATDRDRLLANLATGLRNGCGESRIEGSAILDQVTPSEAAEGSSLEESSAERVTTRGPSPNGNDPHECPAPHLVAVGDLRVKR